MLMDESLHFMRLGTFLERADNTARLVDVKFHAGPNDRFGALPLLPTFVPNAALAGASSMQAQTTSEEVSVDGSQEFDFYHWSAILRSVSGFEIYRKVYRDVIRPERVAELLVLRADMPRSLHASMNEVVSNLAMVANDQSAATSRRAGKLRAELQYGCIEIGRAHV